MSDLMNAIIAAKLVGGGGGGSGLPEIKNVIVPIFPETELTFTSSSGTMMASPTVTLDNTASYVVTFDGTDYTCEPKKLNTSVYYWGNAKIFGLPTDTGEPFCLVNQGGTAKLMTASGASHTFGLSGEGLNYPDGSIIIAKGGEWAGQQNYGYDTDNGVVPIGYSLIPLKLFSFSVTTSAAQSITAHSTYPFPFSISGNDLNVIPANTDCPVLSAYVMKNNTAVAGVSMAYGSYINGSLSVTLINNTASDITVQSGSSFRVCLAVPQSIAVTQS